MFNYPDYSIEVEKRNKFYKPSEKTMIGYKARIDKAWNDKGTSVKRAFTQTSVLLAMGFVSLHLIYA